jgi:hypothetical protein
VFLHNNVNLGITRRELKSFLKSHPELKSAFKFSDNIEDPFRIQMYSLGNTHDPFSWPSHLQEELLDKIARSGTLDEAEDHFDAILDKGFSLSSTFGPFSPHFLPS